ncbi:MAG: 30S ribosomal protein S17e [Candidatus Woesearchaeota archaeon]
MGRIKTQLVKRTTEEIYEKYADSVSKEFEDNKRLLDSKMNIKSKKMRNVIAGYLTRLKKKEM